MLFLENFNSDYIFFCFLDSRLSEVSCSSYFSKRESDYLLIWLNEWLKLSFSVDPSLLARTDFSCSNYVFVGLFKLEEAYSSLSFFTVKLLPFPLVARFSALIEVLWKSPALVRSSQQYSFPIINKLSSREQAKNFKWRLVQKLFKRRWVIFSTKAIYKSNPEF